MILEFCEKAKKNIKFIWQTTEELHVLIDSWDVDGSVKCLGGL